MFLLEEALTELGKICYVLDGDNILHALKKILTFYHKDRTKNIFRIVEKDFIKKNDEFTVNNALFKRGVSVLGVVYAPALKNLYLSRLKYTGWSYKTDLKDGLKQSYEWFVEHQDSFRQ